MKTMRHSLQLAAVWGLAFLILAACSAQPEASSADAMLLATPTQPNVTCEACAQATLSALQTQEKNGMDAQLAATAEIMRANAQATLNSASSTLSAAQTQEQNNANIIAAQIAATAEIERANAQATLVAAAATQNAALTQDAIRQTQVANLATSTAQALVTQQNQDNLVAGTQTDIANTIATQTQAAAATSQWYADQERQRNEQRQGPISFLWILCLPVFVVILAGLLLWGFWRWLKIQQANQRILEKPIEKLPIIEAEIIEHDHHDSAPYLESDVVDSRYRATRLDDQVRGWMDEVKRKLLKREKDNYDNPDD
ncbi:MAG: hypothetical protein HY867_00440 [Chloroflexi bacterium]|nr:hypothetical protein [Chloroflexota bacterium]